MASSNKITLERIDHGVLPKKKNRIHRRDLARQKPQPKDGERVFTTETLSTQSSEYFFTKTLYSASSAPPR
jgi:hypothetical protein